MIDALLPDLRGTPLWERVAGYFEALHGPGFGAPGEPTDPALSHDGGALACTVTVRTDLESAPRSFVLVCDSLGGERLYGHGFASLRTPRWSPTDRRFAALAVAEDGGVQPVVVDGDHVATLPELPGLAEQVQWSPDGTRLLALVADPGADAAGAQGSGRMSRAGAADWLPVVLADRPVGGWRRLWRLEPGAARWERVSPDGMTCWEAAWSGPGRIVAVVSDRPEEAAWFGARVVELGTGDARPVVDPAAGRCVGLPAVSPDGRWVAVVTATCSDRTVVAGDVTLTDTSSGHAEELDLGGLDVTWQGFRSATVLVVAGQRELATVVAEYDVATRTQRELWVSEDATCGQRYPEVGVSAAGVALVVEGYRRPPELAVLGAAGPTVRRSFRHAGHDAVLATAGDVRPVRWTAPDGTAVDGLVVVPPGTGPFPTVTYVHGGPVWAWRSRWSMGYAYAPLFARMGFAVFHPNPRGSSGRGEAFRAAVLGDLGGAEHLDLLSGIDRLVDEGIADPARLGVFGGSHGGFMAAWLVTVTDRFRAAVPYCPVTDWRFMRLTTNDVAAQDHLLAGRPGRDPLAAVGAVTTPTLVLTGSRDLITPASQGLAFHRALAEQGVTTGYVEYPLEGHGVRSFPAQIDFSARALGWFEHFTAAPVAEIGGSRSSGGATP